MDMLRTMAIFTRVLETASFSAAARDLQLGQPAISKAVVALEAHLGVRLLTRSTRRLTATEAGQAFYENATHVLALAEEAEITARGAGAGLEGRLRISVPVTFGRLHLVPKLPLFMAEHKKLRIELLMDDRNVDVLAEKIDVALRLGALADSTLIARKLWTAERLVVASPAYLERYGVPTTPAALLDHEVIVYSQGSGGNDWKFRRNTTETSVRIEGRFQVNAAEGLREAVLAGLGLTIASRWMIGAELDDGQLVAVLQDWTLPAIELWAVHAAGRMVSTKVRTFIRWFERQQIASSKR